MRLPQLILVSVILAISLEAHAKATCICRITLKEHRPPNLNDKRELDINSVPNRSSQMKVEIGNFESCRKRCRKEFDVETKA